eukprot:CAMPEP_0202365772 /NCGR_PEP_ID=MMETSP1126-20121109/16658_1 /ASSEMBLY_ACC=CAM_ASM_000457 /TAXON_ID=3047 /ORGANISM="Dunaliella tertiolecta, Strain CCMP1320" /LENGTH=74 /DNA_ID=CAMNT_0048960705 /DNA_START=2269 /DNA_END=2493 /DNA_ORIENTATION=+
MVKSMPELIEDGKALNNPRQHRESIMSHESKQCGTFGYYFEGCSSSMQACSASACERRAWPALGPEGILLSGYA